MRVLPRYASDGAWQPPAGWSLATATIPRHRQRKKSRRGGIPAGIRPRRPTRQPASRARRVALCLVFRPFACWFPFYDGEPAKQVPCGPAHKFCRAGKCRTQRAGQHRGRRRFLRGRDKERFFSAACLLSAWFDEIPNRGVEVNSFGSAFRRPGKPALFRDGFRRKGNCYSVAASALSRSFHGCSARKGPQEKKYRKSSR